MGAQNFDFAFDFFSKINFSVQILYSWTKIPAGRSFSNVFLQPEI